MDRSIVSKRGLTMEEACGYIGGISRPTMYRLMAHGSVSSYTIGTRRYFLRDSLDAYLEQRLEEEVEGTTM